MRDGRGLWSVLRATLAGVLALSSLHCSSPESNGGGKGGAASGGTEGGVGQADAATRGGSSGAGASTGGAGSGQGGAMLDAMAAQAACEEAVEVQCGRRAECFGIDAEHLADCTDLTAQCPSYFFSPGTGYSVESLTACTEVWETFACEALELGERPDCQEPGTRADGAPCRFRGQCESGVCSAADPKTCGVCLPMVASGDACVDQAQCPNTHDLCDFGHCLQRGFWADPLPHGDPCEFDGHCAGVCAVTAEGPRCAPAPAAGEACATLAADAQGARSCAYGHHCAEGICVLDPTDGSCAPGIEPCTGDKYCDGPGGLAPGQCQVARTPGTACDPTTINVCGEHDSCACEDASCAAHICVRYVGVDAACGNGLLCAAALDCVDGTCARGSEPYVPEECPAAP